MPSRIHLVAPAGSCRRFMREVGVESTSGLFTWFGERFGPGYRVSGDAEVIGADEDEYHGGRHDDGRRARDLQEALGSDDVSAILAIRGGAWFTRILPRIDFSVLERRTRPVVVFGFSELTTLVNIVASYPMGRGVHDTGPAFVNYGLRRHAEVRLGLPSMSAEQGQLAPHAAPAGSAEAWAQERVSTEQHSYLADVVTMIEGGQSARQLICRQVDVPTRATPPLPAAFEARFVGGNLCVLVTMPSSPYATAIDPAGRWLLIEDINEKPERIDRFLSTLTLAGGWDRCAGILVGDFHRREEVLTQVVVELLAYHLPADVAIPVMLAETVGHVWPSAPLPLNRRLSVHRNDGGSFVIGKATRQAR